MKVLLCHNFYQHPGGEDQVFADEATLLETHGHQVVRYTVHNDKIEEMSRASAACRTLFSRQSYQQVRRLIRRERPQLLHATNTFPLISPAVYYAAQAEGVKVVQSLHNYRLLCPNGLLLRNGAACESCIGRRLAWPAIVNKCYRNSRAGSAVVAGMLLAHRTLGTWTTAVDRYIALTEFARQKFIDGGLPAAKISVKPNFVQSNPSIGNGSRGDVLFVGRLSPEKGLETLLDAWRHVRSPLELRIVGDGPLRPQVEAAVASDPRIHWLGRLPNDQVLTAIGAAGVVVCPSHCYETFGRTVIEAYAKGTPVAVTSHGAMNELVVDGQTGVTFEPGQPQALAKAVKRLLASDRMAMRRAARSQFEQHYQAETNYQMLLQIYEQTLGETIPSNEDDRTNAGNPVAHAMIPALEMRGEP